MADQRKATDATGKGIEEEGGGRAGRMAYKPKMPGARGAKAGASRASAQRGATGAEGPATGAAKIPKWKLQSM